MLDSLVRKLRILLQLKQMAILICTPEIKEIFFTKKGRKEIQHDSLHAFPEPAFALNKIISCEDKDNFVKVLLYKLDGTEPEYIIFLEEKNEDGLFVLCGGAECPIRYAQKILGKQFLQNFSATLKQNKWNKHHDIQQEIITTCTKIGQLVLENVDLNSLFNEINNKVKAITGARNAGLFLYDEKSQYLVLQEPAFGIQKGKEIAPYSFSLAENSIVVNVFKNHRAFCNNEATQDLMILGSLTSFLKVDNILAVPLLKGNLCIGAYCLLNRPGGFNQDEEMLIRQMMSQIAVLIESAQQLKQLQNREMEMRRIYQQEKENSGRYKYLMDVHQKLTTILIQEPGLEGIINRIAQHFKMPVVLFDYLRWRRIPSDIGKEKTDTFQLNSLADYFKRLSQNPELYSMKLFRETFSLNGSEDTVVIAALRVRNDIMGFFVVFEDTRKLSQLQILALDRAVHMCTLEFLKQKMAFEVEQNLKDDFLDALIYWNDYKEKDIANMATNFGYDLSRPYLAAVLCLNSVPKGEQPFLQEKKRILRVLSDTLKKNLTGEMVFFKGDDVILLIPHPKENDFSTGYKEINILVTQVQRAVFDAIGISVSIGIGSAAKELKEIKQSYHEARATVDFLQQTGKQGVMFFHELGFYQLFLEQHERKRLEDIAKSQLKELIKSDCSKGTSFLKTLERYFYHDGNLRSTSDDLHVHINTLRYRLKVLKDTFNIDLTAEKRKFDTHFAIKTLFFICPDLFKLR